ncbi:MAG: zinc-dependent alcohol dehydrogenase family protein [Sphaerochaetaceae bacterium]|nr:zinc-dependent alcohol dehydrogenase family protein [Sphaerochaetaceae bacterium]
MKALVIEKKDTAHVVDLPIPEPGEGEVRIRVAMCGICGTDVHIFRGDYLGSYPIVPGHEFSGAIDKVGAGVNRFKVGDKVAVEPNISCNNCTSCFNNRQNFCENWEGVGVTMPGGFAEYVCVPEKAVFALEGVSLESGAFMEPLSCVLHGVKKANLHSGDKVLIMGAGPIGILLLKTVLAKGAGEVTQLDKNESRLALAQESGAAKTVKDIKDLEYGSYDMVIDATGVPFLLEASLSIVRKGGTLLWFAVPHKDATVTLSPFEIFEKGLTIMGTFTSVRNSLEAVSLLANRRIVVEDLISHRLPLEDFEKGVNLIENSVEGTLKVMIDCTK